MKDKVHILNDHKKIGSKFIPPLSQLGVIEANYVKQFFPEIIWLGLLNKREGYQIGIKIIEFMAKKSSEISNKKEKVNFSLASSYNSLDPEQKEQLISELVNNDYLSVLQNSLAPLICLYKGFPMAFIGPPTEYTNKKTMLSNLKVTVSECINKYEQPGAVLQAIVMYIRGITGGLYFSAEVTPPDLNKIITDYNSEEGIKAASSVRSFIISEYMQQEGEKEDEWIRLFWNQNYKLDKCYFQGYEND